MNKANNFHPIDIQTWPMAQAFHYYTQMAPTTYTVNVTMDVTILRKTLKSKGYKFFPAYLYLVTRAISKQQELRIAVHDGILGYWDNLTPAYPQFHMDDKTTSLLWTEYDRILMCFINSILKIRHSMGIATVFYHQKVCRFLMLISYHVFRGLLSTVFHYTIME